MATKELDSNPDPITKAPGSHPVGTGLGATGGGTAGAAIGAMAGPVGALAGAAIGAVVGGLAGKGVAEAIDPTVEDAYWRDNYSNEEYVEEGESYDDYAPAYRVGYTGYSSESDYVAAEPKLEQEWEKTKGKSKLSWDKAKHAVRSGWDRVEHALPGDADKDGK